MKKKGFTLVELLAVIVVLSVISLIAVPIVLNIVETSNKKTAEVNAYGYVKAVNYHQNMAQINPTKYTELESGIYDIEDIEIDYDGTGPTKGKVTIGDITVSYAELVINGYEVEYAEKEGVTIIKKASTPKDETDPILALGNVTTTTQSIEVEYTASDPESGIRKVECSAEANGDTKNGKIRNNKCVIEKLKNNETYTVTVKAVNTHKGETTEVIENVVTKNFKEIGISREPSENVYARERVITLSGYEDGTTLQYKIDDGNWNNYSAPFTISNNVNIYVRLTDGTNTTDSETYIENKIDETDPTLLVGKASTTSSITLTITASDNETGIASTECKITSPSVINGTISGNTCTFSGLTVGTNYTYYVKVVNGVGAYEEASEAITTGVFSEIEIVPTTSGWARERTISINGTTEGATKEYKIGNGSWTTYTEPFTINTNGSVYARFNDGTNTSEEETYAESYIDETNPSIVIDSISTTTSTVTIEYTAADTETHIASATCGTTTGITGTASNGTCTISGLTNNTGYTYEVTVVNGVGRTNTASETRNTENFTSITMTPNPNYDVWAQLRTITLTGSSTGSTLQYKIGNGSWTNYSSPFVVTSNDDVYARFYDGTNTSEEETYTESKIDTTPPTLVLGEPTNITTTSITVPISTNSDSQSGVVSTTCQTTTGISGTISNNNCVVSGLSRGTEYTITVTSTDDVNNSTTESKTATTLNTVTITFNAEGGSAVASQDKTPGTQFGTLPTTTKSGYIFKGWYTAASGGTKIETTSTVPSTATEYHAQWKAPVCKRATTLHSETCDSSSNWGCSKMYGSTVTYGKLGSSGYLNVGDAFDCDVNGDGIYNSTNERFYYVSDYYDTCTKSFNNNYAVLIYYSNISGANPTQTYTSTYRSQGYNNYGPTSAKSQLPTTSQWSNVSLYKTNRCIIDNYGATSTSDGALPTSFSYSGYAARLLTYQELTSNFSNSCGMYYRECMNVSFLYEKTRFVTHGYDGNPAEYWWLETPVSSSSQAWAMDCRKNLVAVTAYVDTTRTCYSDGSCGDIYGVRPVIEVAKTDMSY